MQSAPHEGIFWTPQGRMVEVRNEASGGSLYVYPDEPGRRRPLSHRFWALLLIDRPPSTLRELRVLAREHGIVSRVDARDASLSGGTTGRTPPDAGVSGS